ncbi:MAG TPA: DegV family protein [Clostridia bacterium]|nr:DegV family protein [Clostridia bacterium]
MSYKIIVDTGSNFTAELGKKYNVDVLRMPVQYEDENGNISPWDGIDYTMFYEMLRNKVKITTSCISYDNYYNSFEEHLKNGTDILYVGFSSALSATYQNSLLAAEDLKEKYPERKIYVVDSLCAALGCGLLIIYATQKRDSGLSIEELNDWIIDNRLNVCHWFTVDDLFFLKRGGRLQAGTAVVGSILSIKPIMHVDNEGRLIPVSKVRGRNSSLTELVNRMEQNVFSDVKGQKICISHGDCIEDAQKVAQLVKDKFSVEDILIENLDPLVSAHSGPGTVALFFMGEKR